MVWGTSAEVVSRERRVVGPLRGGHVCVALRMGQPDWPARSIARYKCRYPCLHWVIPGTVERESRGDDAERQSGMIRTMFRAMSEQRSSGDEAEISFRHDPRPRSDSPDLIPQGHGTGQHNAASIPIEREESLPARRLSVRTIHRRSSEIEILGGEEGLGLEGRSPVVVRF